MSLCVSLCVLWPPQYNETEQINGTGGCLLETLNLSSFGALHGAFHVGRILGAINTQIDCHTVGCNYAAITFETFVVSSFRHSPAG